MKSFCVLLFLLGVGSQASVLAEPDLGYAVGSGGGGGDNDLHGLTYGGRLGVSHLSLMAGAEFLTGKFNLKPRDGSQSHQLTSTNFGAFAGLDLPFLFRVYGTYFLSPTATKDTAPTSTKYTDSWAAKFGVGFLPVEYVSLNLEWFYGEYRTASGGQTGESSALIMRYVLFSLSFPFYL